jgi:hypothetical protein
MAIKLCVMRGALYFLRKTKQEKTYMATWHRELLACLFLFQQSDPSGQDHSPPKKHIFEIRPLSSMGASASKTFGPLPLLIKDEENILLGSCLN